MQQRVCCTAFGLAVILTTVVTVLADSTSVSRSLQSLKAASLNPVSGSLTSNLPKATRSQFFSHAPSAEVWC